MDRLERDTDNEVIGGVCSGVANYTNIDTAIIRIIMLILLFSGVGLLPYLIMWICMPAKKESENEQSTDN